jgi:hypothetical protein
MAQTRVENHPRPYGAGPFAIVILIALVLAVPALVAVNGVAPSSQSMSGSGNLRVDATPVSHTVTDDQTTSVYSPYHSTLVDSVTYGGGLSGQRSYSIHLTASRALPGTYVKVTTFPIIQWGNPDQLPGGGDNLPPLTMWAWSIWDQGRNVSAGWTVTSWNQQISGITTWTNQTILVRGSTNPDVTVTVLPMKDDGTYAPGVGFVMNTPGVAGSIPYNDPTFTSTAAALHPEIVRFSTNTEGVDRAWDKSTNQPTYDFAHFNSLVTFAHETGAGVLLSLPAGTWGDGNTMPEGMPLNYSVQIPGPGGIGYFPANGAWTAFVDGIVNHTIAAGQHIVDWTIGNELPMDNWAIVEGYTNLFNLASIAIHAKLPNALVGSDDMTNTTYEEYFANHAQNVGFLSFHYYASVGICIHNGVYCPPEGAPLGSTDSGMFSHASYRYLGSMYSPNTAQDLWHNYTGKWIPVLNAETNLNPVGGSFAGGATGTDPRTQTLFGASWITSVLIDSAFTNVSDVVYYTLSSGSQLPNTLTTPYGGWGYGLTSVESDRQNALYAPYYALELWGESFPAGAPGVIANSSATSVIHAYATLHGTSLSVMIENRANVRVTTTLDEMDPSYQLASVTTLDQNSYGMVYEAKEGKTVLRSDNMKTNDDPGGKSIVLNGYGVAVAKYTMKNSSDSEAPSGRAASAIHTLVVPPTAGTGPARAIKAIPARPRAAATFEMESTELAFVSPPASLPGGLVVPLALTGSSLPLVIAVASLLSAGLLLGVWRESSRPPSVIRNRRDRGERSRFARRYGWG